MAKRPVRLTVREEQKQRTRERLLAAAAEVFASAGYGPATIDQLAAEAGVSRATFYLHFRSKLEVMQELLESLNPEIDALYRVLSGPPTRATVDQFLSQVFAFYGQHAAIISASTQAEAVDAHHSRAIERLTWSLARKVVGARASKERLLAAAFAVQELDRMAYFLEVRGWSFGRAEAIALLAPHWLELVRTTK